MGAFGTPEHLPEENEYSEPFKPICKNGKISTGKKVLIVILGIAFGLLGIFMLIGAAGSQSVALSLILAAGSLALTIWYLVNATKMKRGWPLLIGAFAIFIVYISSYASIGAAPVKSTQPSGSESLVSQTAIAKSSFPSTSLQNDKSAYEEFTYKEVARNPNNYVGKKAKFIGQVIQVEESGLSNILRVNVTKGDNGDWDDTIYVEYQRKDENESRILENDIVALYGELDGIKTYTTVLGSSVSVPYLKAEFVEIGPDTGSITKDKYGQLKTGMSYADVKNVIGSDGKLLSEIGQSGSKDYTATYQWDGDSLGETATLTFQADKLQSKEQYGLK